MSNQDLIRRGDVLDACQIEPYCYDSDCDSGSKLRARVSALPTATPTLADALALPEVRALVAAAMPFVSPVQNADYGRQLQQYETLVSAVAPFLAPFKGGA